MAPTAGFAKDEKILCFHHELLYEAKILDVRLQDPSDKKSSYQYKVHYKGWKATWVLVVGVFVGSLHATYYDLPLQNYRSSPSISSVPISSLSSIFNFSSV
jgi:hypothetical protein